MKRSFTRTGAEANNFGSFLSQTWQVSRNACQVCSLPNTTPNVTFGT
jgi:hypothetical protein